MRVTVRASVLAGIFALGVCLPWQAMASCVIKMGYRTNERAPLIAKAPDNAGLYQDLYAKAAEKIGCTLEVKRDPKKRIIHFLEEGQIDFYPGFNFTEKRAKIARYFDNGLPGGDVGLSHGDVPQITELAQLSGRTLLSAKGSPDFLNGIDGVKVHSVRELTLDKAVKLLQMKRADVYIYNKATVEFYLKSKGIKDLVVHPDCCGGIKPLYLGFSRKSPNLTEIPNPDYDAAKPMTPGNFPTLASPDSVAYKFGQALLEMKNSGETDKIYNQYYQ